MPNHLPSITTADGEVGTNFVTAPAGLSAVVAVHHGTIVRRQLGALIGYACFGSNGSEAVYADAGGLQRSGAAPLQKHHDADAEFKVR